MGAVSPELLADGALDVLDFRRHFAVFMREHGHPDVPQPSLEEIERVLSESRYLP